MTSNRANNPQSFMGQYGQALADRGYSILPIQPGTKKPGQRRGSLWRDMARWSDRCGRGSSDLDLEQWLSWDDAGIGLACGLIACIDIDVLEHDCAIKIEGLAKRMLGDTPLLRIGRAPKRMLIYGVSMPFKGFKKHPIEVHCLGQQVVAYGVHPDTGAEYQWPDAHPVDIDIRDLTVITERQAREFLDRAYEEVPESLRPAVLAFKGGDARGPELGGKRREGGTIEAVTAALEFIPNDNLAYDDWLRIGQSIKAGLSEMGRPLWEAWSAKSSKDDYATTIRTWRSLNPTKITVGTIYKLAQDAGWSPPFELNLHANYDPLAVHAGQAFFDRPPIQIKDDIERPASEPQAAPKQTLKPMPAGWDDVGGVLKQMMQLMVDTAYRPQPELALGASIAAVGALMGRRYRAENGTRPNVYVVGIGKSGSGKNHARNVIDRLFDQAGVDRYLGASRIASSSGLIKALTAQPTQLYMLDEFGLFLEGITDRRRAPRYLIEIGDLFLQLYTTSDGSYRGTDWAGGGPTERKREPIVNPSLSIYGTTTAGHFWGALGASSKDDGSLARYLIFATSRDYPPENPRGGNIECPTGLVDQLALIAKGGVTGRNLSDIEMAGVAPPCNEVRLSVAARAAFADLSAQLTDELNSTAAVGHESIVARIKENAAKLALIRAVSREAVSPFVEIQDVQWGVLIARHCADSLIRESEERISENLDEANLKRVFRIIQDAGSTGISRHGLTQQTFFIRALGRGAILSDLVESGRIEYWREAGSTKPTDYFRVSNKIK